MADVVTYPTEAELHAQRQRQWAALNHTWELLRDCYYFLDTLDTHALSAEMREDAEALRARLRTRFGHGEQETETCGHSG